MLKKLNLVGIIIGVAIMACSYFVFSFEVETNIPSMKNITLNIISYPENEDNEYYGGDAYTGIQQAAAQAANNLIPVFNAIRANNTAIIELNGNNIKAAESEAKNSGAIISTIKYCVGFVMISVGLTVISKSIEFDLSSGKKEKDGCETEVEM